MGLYAETHFEIICEDNKTAEKVLKVLLDIPEDSGGNTFGQDLRQSDNFIYGFECSFGVQGLNYRLEKIWETIANIKGVHEISAPYLIEGDGFYNSNE